MPPLSIPVDSPETGGAYIGSASNLVSAALQTAGLFTQSDILNRSERFLVALAVLCFVFSVIKGATEFAVSGKAGAIIWALIAPIAVYFLLFTRQPAHTVLHQMGERVTPESADDQIFLLKQIAGAQYYDNTPSVSWVYIKFDNAVSSLVQDLVAFLVDTKNRKDLVNIGREGVFSQLIGLRSSDTQLVSLMTMGLVGECAELTRNSTERANVNSKIETITRANPNSTDLPQLNAELERLEGNVQKLSEKKVPLTNSIGEFVSTLPMDPAPESRESMSCSEVWKATREAFLIEAQNAKQRIADAESGGVQRFDVPWDKVTADVDKLLTSDNPGRANEVIAAYMLRNTMATAPQRGLMEQISVHSPMNTFKSTLIYGKLAQSEAEGELLMLKLFDGFIPYMQGLLLFALSATFPLFSLLLLVPDRVSGFLAWFALWIWVKSWDVGFAFLHTIREFLWLVLQKTTVPDVAKLDWSNPSTVFQVIGSTDPTHGITAYYTIIATLTLFIPVVTAQLCLGASELYGAFKGGLETTPRRYRGFYAHGSRREGASELEREVFRREQQGGLDGMNKAARDYKSKTGEYLNPNDPKQKALMDQKQFQRAEAAGNAISRNMDKGFEDGRYAAHWSKDVVQLKAGLAVFAGRPVTHSPSHSTSIKIAQGVAAERAEMLDIRPLELSTEAATDSHTDHGRSALRENSGVVPGKIGPSIDPSKLQTPDGQ